MKLKKVLSICLVGALAATLLAGCSSSEETTEEQADAEETEEVTEEAEEAIETEEAEDAEDAEEAENEEETASSGFDGFEETVTIVVEALTMFDDSGAEEVIDAVNEITESTINVHLDYNCLDISSYKEQVGLMMAGGEHFDLLMIAMADNARFNGLIANNELMDISGYLDEYAPDIVDMMSDYIEAMTIGDAVYGIPDYRIYNSDYYLVMRQDILDELGLTEQAEAISSWSDAEEIFEAVYEAQDSLPEEMQTTAIIGPKAGDGSILTTTACDVATDDLSGHFGFDTLGDSYKIIYTDDDGNVSNYYASDNYLATIERVRDWYEKGWVYKDAQTSVDNGDTSMRNGVSFCYFVTSEIGVESAKRQSTGYDVVCVPVCPEIIQTSDGTNWGWGVPVTATEPEAAVAFLNLLYTNEDLVNLFVYGIEGRDYELNDEGEAVILDDGLYQSSDWLFGNQFLAYPSEGEGGDFRELALDATLGGDISPYYGFSIDTDPIANELAAAKAVIDQYGPGIQSGAVDPADSYQDMLDEMDSAGMQIIIDFYQEALDEWLATQ